MEHAVRRLLLAVVLVFGAAVRCAGQASSDPLTVGHSFEDTTNVALTFCVDNVPRSFISAELVGTDYLQEVVVHEARHRWQYQQRVNAGQSCEDPDMTVAKLFEVEVDAYCASNVVRIARTGDPAEASLATIDRLLTEFLPLDMSFGQIVVGWLHSGCPSAVVPRPRR